MKDDKRHEMRRQAKFELERALANTPGARRIEREPSLQPAEVRQGEQELLDSLFGRSAHQEAWKGRGGWLEGPDALPAWNPEPAIAWLPGSAHDGDTHDGSPEAVAQRREWWEQRKRWRGWV